MASEIPARDWEACLIPRRHDPAIDEAFKQAYGYVPPLTAYLSGVPWVARVLIALNLDAGGLCEVDSELNELVWVVGHDGDFDAVNAEYYASEGRRLLDPDPVRHIEDAQLFEASPVL